MRIPRRVWSMARRAADHLGIQRVSRQRGSFVDLSRDRTFATFATSDDRKIELFEGYRRRIKKNWATDYWPVYALQQARRAGVPLKADAVAYLDRATTGRTLPASLDEAADLVADEARRHPQAFLETDILSHTTRRPIIAARLAPEETAEIAQVYRNVAARVARIYAQHGRIPAPKAVALEAGCGLGHALVALTTSGFARGCGIDYRAPDYGTHEEFPKVSTALGYPRLAAEGRVLLGRADITKIPFDDATFDLVYGASVLEHIHDLPAGLAEMARVLRPGGVVVQSFNLWFSPGGGHASCTLDFPWGHARLSRPDFVRYIETFRPHEKVHALKMYDEHFTTVPSTAKAIEHMIEEAGLGVLAWNDLWSRDHLATSAICADVRRFHPQVTMRDLGVDDFSVVLGKADA